MSDEHTDASLRDLAIAIENLLDNVSEEFNGRACGELGDKQSSGTVFKDLYHSTRIVPLTFWPRIDDSTGIRAVLIDVAFRALSEFPGRGDQFPQVFHDDSSTGDGPAATGSTDRVGVAARRGDESSPDGHANSTARIIRQLAELQRSVLDVLSWWDIVHGDPASEVAEGFLADAIAALRKEVRR